MSTGSFAENFPDHEPGQTPGYLSDGDRGTYHPLLEMGIQVLRCDDPDIPYFAKRVLIRAISENTCCLRYPKKCGIRGKRMYIIFDLINSGPVFYKSP